jgi:hypothetical protein
MASLHSDEWPQSDSSVRFSLESRHNSYENLFEKLFFLQQSARSAGVPIHLRDEPKAPIVHESH